MSLADAFICDAIRTPFTSRAHESAASQERTR
jgi:hypothetical protein